MIGQLMSEGTVRVRNLRKEFGTVTAVDGLDFEIKDGEFFTFLGPSGCGKTTTLRMIAGFELPTSGTLELGDRDVTGVPPYDRNVGMVFQSYALFPHKTVSENVAFGLKMEGVEKEERRSRASEALEMVDLPGFEDRSPTDLSGGQQQRVALARALVIEPDVLLLDEPLANLDLKLRQQMRVELKRLQDEIGITTVYVTHDQREALSMSDRILVMNDGHAEQCASPATLYNDPANEFVADFIGETNLLPGTIKSESDDSAAVVELSRISDTNVTVKSNGAEINLDEEISVNIRPEDLRISNNGTEGDVTLEGTITEKTYYGQVTTFHVDVEDQQIRVDSFARSLTDNYKVGDDVTLHVDADDCKVIPN